AALAGDDTWRDKADRLIAAVAPLIAENLYMHMAMLNAIDLRLRGAEIVVTGQGAGADTPLAAAPRRPPPAPRGPPAASARGRPGRSSCRFGRGAAGKTPGAREVKRRTRAASLRLCRRNLFAADYRCFGSAASDRCDAAVARGNKPLPTYSSSRRIRRCFSYC